MAPPRAKYSIAMVFGPLALSAPGVAFGQDSSGADVGGFRVSLALDVDAYLDDNVYAQRDGGVTDVYVRTSPKLNVKKDTSRYKFNLGGAVTRFDYAERTRENRWDRNLNAGLELEPIHDTFVRGRTSYSFSHEDRGDPNNDASSVSPTPYGLWNSELSLSRELGRLKMNLDGSLQKYNYRDTARNDGGSINNGDRDRTTKALRSRLQYQFSPGYSVVLRGEWTKIDYVTDQDDFGIQRDSTTWRGTAGLYVAITNLVTGEVFAGYQTRSYRSGALRRFSSPVFGAALVWSAAPGTKVRIAADRRIEETALNAAKNYVITTLEVAADREFGKRLSASLGGRIGRNDFLGLATESLSDIARKDTLYSLDATVRYKLPRNMAVGLSYALMRRNSAQSSLDFNRNKLNLSLSWRM
ncbi:outer membrane beta-barrel protein [Novosphingobium jiangmenense]|uniref:Outer membrane beta-barrel protein n=1 Tax=Novosphingobium jiangmenense TaxID=2791981 RepID=A0ABS0HBL6_9SPHN|nr:outer membrane beta-barrel protein [Novosphingobium jiangmenense]MBF9149670.1 outer membrane beta-barrel protein [Novosphingobium jiangmenense]